MPNLRITRLLEAVNRAFSPTEEEAKWAEDVFVGKDEAEAQGVSVWVKDGMMIGDAMIARATNIMNRERAAKRK